MSLVVFALYIVAFVFFVLAGLGVPPHPRVNWLGWGFALWVLAIIISDAYGAHAVR